MALYNYEPVLETMIACSVQVREALLEAEFHRLAEIVGMGADGAETTHIDQVAEDAALAYLETAEPRMNILSEEAGFFDRGSELTAIVDPIDATNNAIALPNFSVADNSGVEVAGTPLRTGHVLGFPYYAFSIGILKDGEMVAGCVRNLPTGETFTAARGHGVCLDGIPVTSSGKTAIQGTTIGLIRPETDTAYEVLRPIMVGSRARARVRLTGCSALDLALIACGGLDAMINPNLVSPSGYGEKIVDYAGGLALLTEVGGILTGLDGTPISRDLDLTQRTPLFAAATPELHAALLEVMQEVEWDEQNL